MRLLTVGSLPPEWGGVARGGVATFHAALLEGLAERRADVEVIGVLPPAPPTRDVGLPIFARPDDVGIAEFYEDVLARLQPDAVLMNHVATSIGVAHARLTEPPPAVGIAHSWHSITFRSGEERQRARAVTEEALSGLSALVCPSQHSLAEGERLGLPLPSRSEVIHYPLQSIYLEAGLDVDAAGRDGVLYVGGLVERKRPAALVQAVAVIPGLAAKLVGEGEQETELRSLIDRLGLAERVRLAELPDETHLHGLRDLLLNASVLCLPSTSESFGIVFIEALACGTPVVGFGPTVREIRDRMGVEIGEPLDEPAPAAIAAAIEKVMAASWDRQVLRKATVASFGLGDATERYLDLLRRSG